jgi:hypothetical protein
MKEIGGPEGAVRKNKTKLYEIIPWFSIDFKRISSENHRSKIIDRLKLPK